MCLCVCACVCVCVCVCIRGTPSYTPKPSTVNPKVRLAVVAHFNLVNFCACVCTRGPKLYTKPKHRQSASPMGGTLTFPAGTLCCNVHDLQVCVHIHAARTRNLHTHILAHVHIHAHAQTHTHAHTVRSLVCLCPQMIAPDLKVVNRNV